MSHWIRKLLVVSALALGVLGLIAPLGAAPASAATPGAGAATLAMARSFTVTRQCQIVQISPNNVVGVERADGSGPSVKDAELAADRNIPVPPGHYKRHCRTVSVHS